jgi:hypothetical protein
VVRHPPNRNTGPKNTAAASGMLGAAGGRSVEREKDVGEEGQARNEIQLPDDHAREGQAVAAFTGALDLRQSDVPTDDRSTEMKNARTSETTANGFIGATPATEPCPACGKCPATVPAAPEAPCVKAGPAKGDRTNNCFGGGCIPGAIREASSPNTPMMRTAYTEAWRSRRSRARCCDCRSLRAPSVRRGCSERQPTPKTIGRNIDGVGMRSEGSFPTPRRASSSASRRMS